MRGRQPDPTRARRGTGNRPVIEPETGAEVVVLGTPGRSLLTPPPDDLPADVHPLWNTVMAELEPRGLRDADHEAIRQMCLAAHRHRQATAAIERYGILVQGSRGPMTNPMVKVEKDMASVYMRIAEAYGLTIAARLRLGLMQLAGESLLSSLNADLDRGVGRG